MNKQLSIIWSDLEKQLFNFIKKKISNNEDAEDILQEVYIKLHQNIHLLKDEDKIISWIYQITRNTINDCYKKCNRIKLEELDDKHFILKEDSDENFNLEITESIKRIIEEMPPNLKEILNLFEFQNNSHKEISKKLEINLNNSKIRLKRARERLKKDLENCCAFKIDEYGSATRFVMKSYDMLKVA
ncbi:MAG: sigma-70 family RNA polymerase sigma factor [Fusobacteriaceae bacterium]